MLSLISRLCHVAFFLPCLLPPVLSTLFIFALGPEKMKIKFACDPCPLLVSGREDRFMQMDKGDKAVLTMIPYAFVYFFFL